MKHFATAMVAFGIMLAAIPAARAAATPAAPAAPAAPATATTTCPPNPTPGSTVSGNLIVPPGAVCSLFGVTVTGNVVVQTNATVGFDPSALTTIVGNLHLGAGTTFEMERSATTYLIVDGNVTANQCAVFLMASFTIRGNVSVENCTEQRRAIGISGLPTNTTVDGNFTCWQCWRVRLG